MGVVRYCWFCALEAPIQPWIGVNILPCTSCGQKKFVPEWEIRWEAKLTDSDRQFLKVNKISA